MAGARPRRGRRGPADGGAAVEEAQLVVGFGAAGWVPGEVLRAPPP